MSNTFKSYRLNVPGFEKYLFTAQSRHDGIQYLYKFPNSYGASVIKHTGSIGFNDNLWELAVVKWNDDLKDGWRIVYDTEITDDIIGNLSDGDVRSLLERISKL